MACSGSRFLIAVFLIASGGGVNQRGFGPRSPDPKAPRPQGPAGTRGPPPLFSFCLTSFRFYNYEGIWIVVSNFRELLGWTWSLKSFIKSLNNSPQDPRFSEKFGFICIFLHANSQVKRTLPSRVMTENVLGWDNCFWDNCSEMIVRQEMHL